MARGHSASQWVDAVWEDFLGWAGGQSCLMEGTWTVGGLFSSSELQPKLMSHVQNLCKLDLTSSSSMCKALGLISTVQNNKKQKVQNHHTRYIAKAAEIRITELSTKAKMPTVGLGN